MFKWQKNPLSDCHEQLCFIDGICIAQIGVYGKYWYPDHSRGLGELYDVDQHFDKMDKCKKYIEKTFKVWLEETYEKI